MSRNEPQTSRPALLHGDLTKSILKVFYQVHSELGFGFAESIYSNAMAIALKDAGLDVEREVPIAVFFRGIRVGSFRADIVVNGAVLLELKAGAHLDESCEPPTLNYLRATSLEVALLLHFANRAHFRRLLFTNDRKLVPRPPRSP